MTPITSSKLHIGPGKTYLPGWINVDIFSNVKADIYSSALALPYPMESFDLIYASHVLEHFNKHMVLAALTHWQHLLKEGGRLRLAVPDFKAICTRYMLTGDVSEVMGLLYGGQLSLLNNHCVVFDYDYLGTFLKKAGFSTWNFWDWRTTDHSEFDDYSQAYLPHMEKVNGMLMSLNVEAVK